MQSIPTWNFNFKVVFRFFFPAWYMPYKCQLVICTLTLMTPEPPCLESFQSCYNVLNIIHIAALTEHVWISCLSCIQANRQGLKQLSSNVCRQNWTKAVAGKGCVWSGIPSSSLGSCGHGWSSLKSPSSPSRKPKPWTPTALMLKLSSTH